jgi:AbrB family looped-hinge helix DNA binding protein
VIPRYIREKLEIKEGMLVSIEEREDGVLLRP